MPQLSLPHFWKSSRKNRYYWPQQSQKSPEKPCRDWLLWQNHGAATTEKKKGLLKVYTHTHTQSSVFAVPVGVLVLVKLLITQLFLEISQLHFDPAPSCAPWYVVLIVGTPSTGAPTWTESSTCTQETAQSTSWGSWTARRTPGTTSPSSPLSSVSSHSAATAGDGCLSEWNQQQLQLFSAPPSPLCRSDYLCFCLIAAT